MIAAVEHLDQLTQLSREVGLVEEFFALRYGKLTLPAIIHRARKYRRCPLPDQG